MAHPLDKDPSFLLISSLAASRDVRSISESLVRDLRQMVDFDIGRLQWRPLDQNYDDSSLEFSEDDMPDHLDFAASQNIFLDEDVECGWEETSLEEGPVFVDCFNGSYRARTSLGDPIQINLRSVIHVPLHYDDLIIGKLSLFSSRERRSTPELKNKLEPIWSIIGHFLGYVLRMEALERERDRSRDLLDGTDDLLIVWRNRDSMWQIDYNRKAEELIDMKGIIPDMLEGPFFVPPGKEWERAMAAWSTTFESGEPYQMDLVIEDREGIGHSFLCKFRSIEENLNIVGVRMTGIEMDTLDSGVRQLESTNRRNRLLLSLLAHDLKNPLSAMSGYTELLEYADEEKKRSYIGKMVSLTRRMSDTISLTQTYAQLQEGKLLSDLEEIHLRKMLDNCIEVLYPKTNEHRILLEPGQDDIVIKGHRFIEQVILNLLDNAMKYGKRGGEIRVDLETDLEGTVLSVSDNGPGVPDEYKTVIFDRFSRGENGPGIMGAGLGLAISKGIVDLHHGRIWVEDNPLGGSVFKVFLPWDGV